MVNQVTIQNKEYPELLKRIPDPPAQLYYKGIWREELFENCLAVVGSRRMTQYGKRATELIVGEVASAGVTIVSGFMYGIDATAHKAALLANGRTIAVMPCGIERIHPEYQKDLYENILKTGGLIVSEWEGEVTPKPWTYPRRNRIVAGLARATLVMEAGLGSGSLITADFARKFQRIVCAVPGPITSEVSKGTAKLVQEGAQLVSCADDILGYYDKKGLLAEKVQKVSLKNPIEQKILEALQQESLQVDVLARILRIASAELGTALSLMEIQGIVKQEQGKYYVD